MTHGNARFQAVVFSRFIRGEELFWAEVRTALPGGYRCIFSAAPQENYQSVLCSVLDWSRRQGKPIDWDYQLAKDTSMKRLISTGAAHVVGPPGAQAGTLAAPKLSGSGVASLSRQESAELFDCEKTIERGLDTFVEVGQAMIRIKDSRLYRYGYDTFEDYVRERWGMSVRHAYRLVDSAKIATNLLPAPAEPVPDGVTNWSQTPAPPLPTNESQVRPLKGLAPEEQRRVWGDAIISAGHAPVTAKHVEAARERLHPKPKCDHKFIDSDSCLKCGWTPPKPREVQVEMSRVQPGGDIDQANCHTLLQSAWGGDEHPELKNVFEFERELWVTSIGHHGGSPPDKAVSEHEAHQLIADNGMYAGPPPAEWTFEGRYVLWKGSRMRLGPVVMFKAQGRRGPAQANPFLFSDFPKIVPVKAWPKPNAQGVYDQAEAECLQYTHDKLGYARIFLLQIAQDSWIAAKEVCFRKGNAEHTTEPLTGAGSRDVFGSREGALNHKVDELIEQIRPYASARPPRHPEQARVAAKMVQWACCLPSGIKRDQELALEVESVPGPEPKEVRIRLAADQIIKDAISLQVLAAFLPTKPVIHLSVAVTHLRNFRNSVDQAVDSHRKAVERNQRENSKARKSAARKSQVAVKRRKGAKDAAAKPKTSLLCRVNQSGKPTFRRIFGGWSDNPKKAKIFASPAEAQSASTHSYDKPVSFKRAVELAGKWRAAH